METTILVLRDTEVPDSIYSDDFMKEVDILQNPNLQTVPVTFDDAREDRLPYIASKKIIAMPFFPWKFRNRNIQNLKRRDGHYGGHLHKKTINDFYMKVDENLRNLYGERLSYINPMESICLARDKKTIKKALNQEGISTPVTFETKNVDELIGILEKDNLYIKFRVGGDGKGITYLTKDKWLTNIDWDKTYEKTPFVNTHIDPFQTQIWEFKDVTGNTEFLEDLLQRYVIIEKEVDFPLIDGMKYDLRTYMVFNRPVFILPRLAYPENIVTNWSRGGIVPTGDERTQFLEKIPRDTLKKAKKTATDASRIVGANFIGLDLIFSKDYEKVYVLEGQTDPTYTKQFNLSKELVKSTLKELVELPETQVK